MQKNLTPIRRELLALIARHDRSVQQIILTGQRGEGMLARLRLAGYVELYDRNSMVRVTALGRRALANG